MNNNITIINIIQHREENHLNKHDSHLEIEFNVSGNIGSNFANDADFRLVSDGVLALFSSVKH